MLHKRNITMLTVLIVLLSSAAIMGQPRDSFDQSVMSPRIDRYLDVEVWTNHDDGDYFEGDNIVFKYRANDDAFIAIYSIDTKGRVNLLFPSSPEEDNFIRGSVTYRLPDGYDDYDLVVTGPEGIETVQIVASRERFPIPDWYNNSDLMFDWDDRHEFLDYVNSRYFVKYDGQRFAYDRTTIYVNEWEPYYFQPVYYPTYPSWTVSGNVYLDYAWGSSVYINGVYWGSTPLYVPRIYVGWHTFTIYDPYGYCWESNIHITRYHTVVIDRDIVVTSPGVYSKYKDVRVVGYRNPSKNGYPKYKSRVTSMKTAVKKIRSTSTVTASKGNSSSKILSGVTKKYNRGSTKLVKTNRGYETSGSITKSGRTKTSTSNDRYKSKGSSKSKSRSTDYTSGSSRKSKQSGSKYRTKTSTSSSGRKSGSTKSTGKTYKTKTKTKSGSSKGDGSAYKTSKRSTKSSKAKTSKVKSTEKKNSNPPKKSSSKSNSRKGTSKKKGGGRR